MRYRKMRRNWSVVVAWWLEILWCCHCSYNNIATDRCLYCGARPPRSIREALRAVPIPPRRELVAGRFPFD